jgi:hypothetical protein
MRDDTDFPVLTHIYTGILNLCTLALCALAERACGHQVASLLAR